MNVQDGLSALMMIIIAHISDTWTGRFNMVLYSTVAYVIGLWLLYFSANFPNFNSNYEAIVLLYLAMVPIAAGIAGRDPTLDAFLGDQMSQQEPNQLIVEERVHGRAQFWSRWNKFLGAIVAFRVFASTKRWKDRFRISAIAMTISGILFSFGFRCYYRKKPTGSPLTDVYFVFKVAISKRHLEYPATPEQFYHYDRNELQLSPHVAVLRWLDKAAIEETSSNSTSPEEQEKRGMLCRVETVRKVKLLLTMAPMWTTFLIYSLVMATGRTFFFLQSSNMDDRMFGGFNVIPLIYLFLIRSFSSFIVSFLYELLVPKLWRGTQPKRAWKVRIGVGMFCSFLSCIAARIVEIHRLKLYKEKSEKMMYEGFEPGKEIVVQMSILWLTPQFFFLGLMEGLCEDGLVDFYYHQVPESMKDYGPPFNQWVLGMGNFLSILWILTLNPWFGNTINESNLDNYYAILAILSLGNLFVYWYVSNMPIYNIEIAKNGVELQEIATDAGDKNLVSKSSIPRSHPSIPNSTHASRSFVERQSCNAWATVRKNFRIHGLKFSHQK